MLDKGNSVMVLFKKNIKTWHSIKQKLKHKLKIK